MKKQLYIWVVALLLASSCAKDDINTESIRGQRFRIGVENYEGQAPEAALSSGGSRGVGTAITQLKTAIYDASGRLMPNLNGVQSPDFENFTVEGLPDGDYTAVFMGVGEVLSEVEPTITAPEQLGEEWMPKVATGKAVANEYLYAQQPFKITAGQGANADVELCRIVGRIDIEPVYGNNQWTQAGLTSVAVSFDDGTIHATHLTGDTYSGEHTVTDLEVVEDMSFYTLPTIAIGKSPGHIVLRGVMSDGEPYEVRYEFTLKVERNKRAVLRPRYMPDGDQFGTLRVYDHDRNAGNSRLFFQDGDSYKAVAARTFRPIEPLVVSFEGNKMVASFYAALPAHNVILLARRPVDNEYFELAWFESVLGFEDRTVDLSEQSQNKLYRTESGKVVVVDKLTNDMTFKYRSDDALIQKLLTITWPGEIRFVQPGADTLYNKNGDLPLRAVHAREAVAMFTNMAFVFSHPYWKRDMLASEVKTPFTDNKRVVSCEQELFPRIWNANSKGSNYIKIHVMSPTTEQGKYGVANIGNGDYLTMQQHVYTKHYATIADNTALVTAFHEYSHTLGYGKDHIGNLTYNEFSTVTMNVRRALQSKSEEPYPSPDVLKSLSNLTLYKKDPGGSIL